MDEGGISSPSSSSNSLYRECLRNHAASLGSYATDGCGEFIPDDMSPGGGLQCAACGCHRNFHRKVTYPSGVRDNTPEGTITTHELMDYSEGRAVVAEVEEGEFRTGNNKKRFRTKFSEEQKEKMLGFAEKIGWKLQRISKEVDDEVERFCRSVGVSRQVFKVWMHNHKNSSSSNGNASSLTQ